MHYKILVTKSFESDLDSVLLYISGTLKNRSAAGSLLKKVKDNIMHFLYILIFLRSAIVLFRSETT